MAMDVPREGARKRKIIRRVIWITLLAVSVPLITVGLSRLKPAAPSVEAGTLWTDVVRRGPMIRNTRGLGTLVPEEILYIPAQIDARVEKVNIRPGAPVRPETVIMVLSNPDLSLAAEDLKWQVRQAEANYEDLRVKLETANLDLRATLAKTESEYVQAKLRYEKELALSKEGLTPDLNVGLAKAAAEELGKRLELDKKRLEISTQSVEAQLASQKVQIEKLRAAWDLKKRQVDELNIRAGADGVLQEMALEPGQRVPVGTVLAKVAQPSKLKAELRVPETQAKDVMIGQVAEVDTHNGIIPGKVSRIDPAAVNGNVRVDIRLEGPLPAGARPDLSVDGTIVLERLADVLYVQRPVSGQPNSLIGLFKVTADGKEANRVQVRIGRVSVQTVEILDGLRIGEKVILSDMSQWDGQDRLRLN
jgi:HlyD family secretion protein